MRSDKAFDDDIGESIQRMIEQYEPHIDSSQRRSSEDGRDGKSGGSGGVGEKFTDDETESTGLNATPVAEETEKAVRIPERLEVKRTSSLPDLRTIPDASKAISEPLSEEAFDKILERYRKRSNGTISQTAEHAIPTESTSPATMRHEQDDGGMMMASPQS